MSEAPEAPDNVVNLFGEQLYDETTDDYLDKVRTVGLKNLVVIGESENGEFYFGGNTSDMRVALWLVMNALWWFEKRQKADI